MSVQISDWVKLPDYKYQRSTLWNWVRGACCKRLEETLPHYLYPTMSDGWVVAYELTLLRDVTHCPFCGSVLPTTTQLVDQIQRIAPENILRGDL